ncbi:MAG: thioredoxin family protein [Beijerinckiaceae bacterium]
MINRRFLAAALVALPCAARAQSPAPTGRRLIGATLYDDYSPQAFERLLAARRSFIVHVHAEWCSACRMQEARLKTLLVDPAIRALPFVRVDFDRDGDFRRRYRVTAQSTLLVFKNGREVARSTGETAAGALQDMVMWAL